MENDHEAQADDHTFKDWLREEPHLDDFPGTPDVRAELPQHRDIGLGG